MARRSYLKTCFLFGFYFIFAVIITWPLLPNISTVIPIGTERTTTIPLFGLWSLLWNAEQAPLLFQGYWDAPIFYPTTGTFAFSETMLPQGVFQAIGLFFFDDPLLVYNLMLLFCLALNGLGAYHLLRTINISDFPAGLAGLFAVALPYAANEIGVCQLIVLFPIFYFFTFFYQFSRGPKLKQALLMGLWGGILALCCSYYGLFLSVFSILGAVCFFNRSIISIRSILYLLCGICLAGLLALPVLLPQLLITAGFSHSASAIQMNSCRLADYLTLAPMIFGADFLPWLGGKGAIHPMYPGTGMLILAFFGVWFGKNREPRWVIFCVLGAMLALVLSMGSNLNILGWNLLDFLRGFYPGFKQLRNSFRFGVFTQFFLVGLIGFTLEKIYRAKSTKGLIMMMFIFLLSIIEVLPITQMRNVPDNVFSSPWSDFLATQPEGPALMLPMAVEDTKIDYNYLPIVTGMIHALHHNKPLLNGMSSFRPPDYPELKRKMTSFPDRTSLTCLCDREVDYLIVDKNFLSGNRADYLNNMAEFTFLYADDVKCIFRVICD